MINRILNISRNWQTSGWKYILFGAIVVLFICWLFRDLDQHLARMINLKLSIHLMAIINQQLINYWVIIYQIRQIITNQKIIKIMILLVVLVYQLRVKVK